MTNEDINALTDSQINVMMTVAVKRIGHHKVLPSGDCVEFLDCIGVSDVEKVKDYCNDPAAMMPIAFENKIMFNPYCNDGEWMCEAPIDFKGISTVFAGVSIHKNPLRAAAIAYLKSKGVL